MPGLTLKSIFDRVDYDHDGKLSHGDIKQFVIDSGVGATESDSWFSRATNLISSNLNIKYATDAFMTAFDTQNTGAVSFEEFKSQGRMLLPSVEASTNNSGVSLQGHLKEHATKLCKQLDSRNRGYICRDELTAFAVKSLEESGDYLSSIKAKEGSKIATRLLDASGDGRIPIKDVEDLAEEIDRQLQNTCVQGNHGTDA